MSLEMLWGEERKCSATVVGLDLVLALSKVRRCSLKRSFKRRLVSPMYCRWHLLNKSCNIQQMLNLVSPV